MAFWHRKAEDPAVRNRTATTAPAPSDQERQYRELEAQMAALDAELDSLLQSMLGRCTRDAQRLSELQRSWEL